jgi:hypothetical protein
MKLTPIAAAVLIPSTLAGIAFSSMPFVNGSSAAALTAHASVRPAGRTVYTVRPVSPTGPAATVKPASTPTQPAAVSQAPATAVAQPAAPQMSAAEASYEKCVAWRESGDNPTASSAGMFGILPYVWAQLGYPGTADQASVAQQVIAFHRLYLEYGTQPWTPSDGC